MLKSLTYGTSFCAVEHSINLNGQECFHLLVLKKNKNELSVDKKQIFNDSEDLLKELKDQKHLFLIINNNQVITKHSVIKNESILNQVQVTFPAIALKDFYFESLKTGTENFIAIVRKSVVNTLIENYNKKGVSIVGFSLGNLAIQNLLPYLKEEIIYSSNCKVVNNSGQIISIENSFSKDEQYTVNNLEISSQFLLPLSGILQYYTNASYSEGLNKEIYKLKKDFEHKRRSKTILYFALGFLLLTTLVNFLFYNYYKLKVLELDTIIGVDKTRRDQFIGLQSEVQQKERLLNSVRLVSNSKVSRYIDEIGMLIPNTILLSELNYQPIAQRVKKGKEIEFNKNNITVKGIVKKDEDFTSLVNEIGKKQWVDELIIISYGKDKGTLNQFEILITIANE